MAEYNVDIYETEKMIISVRDANCANIKIRGGSNFSKDHGFTSLSRQGVENLIAVLAEVRDEMDLMK